jgi:hypothetical protein
MMCCWRVKREALSYLDQAEDYFNAGTQIGGADWGQTGTSLLFRAESGEMPVGGQATNSGLGACVPRNIGDQDT